MNTGSRINDKLDYNLFTSENDVRKKLLDSLLYGFFNSFTADDTTKLEVQYVNRRRDDEECVVCALFGEECYIVNDTLQSIEMNTSCWNDISMEHCKEIVEICGGENAHIDNYIVV